MAFSIPELLRRTAKSALARDQMPLVFGSVAASAAAVSLIWLGSAALIRWLGESIVTWVWLMRLLEGVAGAMIAWMIFPLILPAVISIFINAICARIEKNEYPQEPQGEDMAFLPELWMDVKFALYALFLNILVLPLYLIPGINLLLYYVMNGLLLGKQYFLMVARRHHDRPALKLLMRNQSKTLFIYGLLIVGFSTIPMLNLFAPLLSAALMVHVFHSIRSEQKAHIL